MLHFCFIYMCQNLNIWMIHHLYLENWQLNLIFSIKLLPKNQNDIQYQIQY